MQKKPTTNENNNLGLCWAELRQAGLSFETFVPCKDKDAHKYNISIIFFFLNLGTDHQ